jgi:hypothetical protein
MAYSVLYAQFCASETRICCLTDNSITSRYAAIGNRLVLGPAIFARRRCHSVPPYRLVTLREVWWPRGSGLQTTTTNPATSILEIKALFYLQADMRRSNAVLQRTELWQTDREFMKNSGKEWQPTVLSDKWSNDRVRVIFVQAWIGPDGSRRSRFPEFLYSRQWRWQGCQTKAATAFTHQGVPLVLKSVRVYPGPHCGWKD